MGNLRVVMRHASRRKLMLAGRPAGLAIVALWEFGRKAVTPALVDRIRKKLSPEEFEALVSAAPAMPGWMANAFLLHQGKLRG